MAFSNVLTFAGSTLTGGIRTLSWRDGLSVHRIDRHRRSSRRHAVACRQGWTSRWHTTNSLIPSKKADGEDLFPQEDRQLALGGPRFFSTSASVIIIIIGSTGHS